MVRASYSARELEGVSLQLSLDLLKTTSIEQVGRAEQAGKARGMNGFSLSSALAVFRSEALTLSACVRRVGYHGNLY